MLRRTHLAIGLSLGLYFFPLVNHKILFIPIVLAASLLPDIDSISSSVGRKTIFRPVHWFFEHRGILHSYTVCIIVSIVLTFFYPFIALPFFLGYSFHLFADSFTKRGIRPFFPFKYNTSGMVSTGGRVDKAIFYTFVLVDLFLLILIFLRI